MALNLNGKTVMSIVKRHFKFLYSTFWYFCSIIMNHLLGPFACRRPHWWSPMRRGKRTRATNVSGRNVSMAPQNIQMAAMDSPLFDSVVFFCCCWHCTYMKKLLLPWRSADITKEGRDFQPKHSLPPTFNWHYNIHGGETLNLMTGADISTFTSEGQFGVHQGSKLSESNQRLLYGCTQFLPLVHKNMKM